MYFVRATNNFSHPSPSLDASLYTKENRPGGNPMPQQPQPQWRPITQLALIASHIDGMLEAAQEQYQTLQPA